MNFLLNKEFLFSRERENRIFGIAKMQKNNFAGLKSKPDIREGSYFVDNTKKTAELKKISPLPAPSSFL